jgi:hypothetical protein
VSEPQPPPPAPGPPEVEHSRPTVRPQPRSRRWLAFFAVLAVLGLVAIIVPLVVNLRLQLTPEQIAEARQRWRDNAPASYELIYRVQTETAGQTSEDQYLVQVRDHRPVRVEVNGEKIPLHAAARRGVQGLFDEMERRLQDDRASGEHNYARATFDPTDGHPTHYVYSSRRARTRIEWDLKLTRQP